MIARIVGAIVVVEIASGPAIPAAARKTISETNAAWLEAMKRQDAAAIAAIYGDEAVFITATGEPVRGRAAIERRFDPRIIGAKLIERILQRKRQQGFLKFGIHRRRREEIELQFIKL